MEIFGGLPLPLALAILALVDSLSIGTLLIPVFLLLSPGRVRVGRILLYLATIAGFYFLVGLLFLWGLVNVVDVAADFLASPVGVGIRLAIGIALLVTSFLIPSGKKTADASAAPSAGSISVSSTAASDSWVAGTSLSASTAVPAPTPDASAAAPDASAAAPEGRVTRWRARLLDPRTRGSAVMVVALAAGLVEVATMLPYIMAMTMLADSGVSTPMRVVSLVGYCALMTVPALLLLLLRLVAAGIVQGPLERLAAWMQRTGAENTAWIVGILGFLIARAAATELGLLDGVGSFLDSIT